MSAEVLIKKHPRARHLTLRYQPLKGSFLLTTPRRIRREEVDRFIADHRAWMDEQQKLYPKPQKLRPNDRILYLGKWRQIKHEDKPGVHISVEEGVLHVQCRLERLPRAIQRYMRQQAEKVIVPLAFDKAQRIDKSISSIAFRNSTGRWGSCTRKGGLNFSWRLIMAPKKVIDYVVAHEVAHLQHCNHGDRFWKLCEKLAGDYAGGKEWLDQHSAHLHLLF